MCILDRLSCILAVKVYVKYCHINCFIFNSLLAVFFINLNLIRLNNSVTKLLQGIQRIMEKINENLMEKSTKLQHKKTHYKHKTLKNLNTI